MSNPNLRYASNIYGGVALYDVTTVLSNVLSNAAASNKIIKVNSIFVANTNSTQATDVSVAINDGTTDYYLARNITVPAAASLMVGTKETYTYLPENYSVKCQASVNSNLTITVSYEEIS
jgi:hypothetical protein